MCFDHDSRPPIAPIEGGSLDAKDLVLDAADGNRFDGLPGAPDRARSDAAIVVLPDVRGLHAYYRDLALRFAEHGIEAIAIDYFGRTAGIGDRGPGFDYQPHVAAADLRGPEGRRRRRDRPPPRDRRPRPRLHGRVLHGRPHCRS